MLLALVMVILIKVASSSSKIALVLPGCPDKCGNISIPYPFGVQKHCYLTKTYHVNCKTLQLQRANFKLLDISLTGLMHALSPIAYQCYNRTGGIISHSKPKIRLSRFRLSRTMNYLTSVGCNTGADLYDFTGLNYIAGSITGTMCERLENGSCFGKGCMQVPLPYSLGSFRIHAQRTTTRVGNWGHNNCTYGFLVKKDEYMFQVTDLDNMKGRLLPMALNWTVGDTNCEEAQSNKTKYHCKENSVCVDSYRGFGQSQTSEILGYTCLCAPGYQGNPYLPSGCQDINECEGSLNDCINGADGCVNTYGSYTCMCPNGMLGDGRKHGSGCSPKSSKYVDDSLYAAMGAGTAASVVLTLILYWGLKQRWTMKNREMFFKNNGGLILQKILFESKQSPHNAKIFAARILENATNNFHKTNIIGQGGYGTVYKGTLEDKTTVAIKKSKSIDTNQIEQFINEVVMLSDLHHPNVVRLLGCCLETQTPLLVYEFVTNKTLYHHLHEKDGVSNSMTFERRVNIAAQTAEALAYIHSTTQIIHRDIKSSNILLNDDYTVKVSDFGISRFVPVDESHIQTLVHGTLGYIDPEYFRSGILTNKSDVYSFGMVLVELITGKTVFSHDGSESDLGLAMFFVSILERGCLMQILDEQVKKDGNFEHVSCVAKLAKECIELEGKKRPSMKVVKEELEKVRHSFIKRSIS